MLFGGKCRRQSWEKPVERRPGRDTGPQRLKTQLSLDATSCVQMTELP
jgi:hypothetical protein